MEGRPRVGAQRRSGATRYRSPDCTRRRQALYLRKAGQDSVDEQDSCWGVTIGRAVDGTSRAPELGVRERRYEGCEQHSARGGAQCGGGPWEGRRGPLNPRQVGGGARRSGAFDPAKSRLAGQ